GHAGESGVEQPDAEPQGSPLLLLTHNRNYRPPAHPQAVPGGTARMCPRAPGFGRGPPAGHLGRAALNPATVRPGELGQLWGQGQTQGVMALSPRPGRWPGGAQLGGGDVDAAEPFGRGRCVLRFGAVGQEAAGLPAHSAAGHARAPLVAVGQGSTSIQRWVERLGQRPRGNRVA
ncbi:MAG TPA: hypothetical protein VI036_16005, partial [Propionibacteriaceae bacterium]